MLENIPKPLKIATRSSKLALRQANMVKDLLLAAHPKLEIILVPVTTTGDKFLNTSLTKIGGKGVFIKEVEEALLSKEAHCAVHSLKDVPHTIHTKTCLSAFLKREDPRDALLSYNKLALQDLPRNAIIGTSSLRRAAALRALCKDYNIKPLRGNVGTRLQKLEQENFDAIILAASGLIRLNLQDKITQYLSIEDFTPAVGQGIITVQCLQEDNNMQDLLATINHSETELCATAERSLNKALNGSCQIPISGFAILENDTLSLRAKIMNQTGEKIIQHHAQGSAQDAAAIGLQAAEQLLAQGADKIIQELLNNG